MGRERGRKAALFAVRIVTRVTDVSAVTDSVSVRRHIGQTDGQTGRAAWRSTPDRSPDRHSRAGRRGPREQGDRVRARHQRTGGERARLTSAAAAAVQSCGARGCGGHAALQRIVRDRAGLAPLSVPGRAVHAAIVSGPDHRFVAANDSFAMAAGGRELVGWVQSVRGCAALGSSSGYATGERVARELRPLARGGAGSGRATCADPAAAARAAECDRGHRDLWHRRDRERARA